MLESMSDEVTLGPAPKQWSLVALLLDTPRVDDAVRGCRYHGQGTTQDPFIVGWVDGDGGNPLNWPNGRKWMITLVSAFTCFVVAFGSSAYTGVLMELMLHFNASSTLITAGVSLYVLGFAVGPLLWAPLSEIYGRQVVFLVTYGAYVVFSAACVADHTISSLLAFRFLAGAFGSAPLTNSGGVISDLFKAEDRSVALGVFSLAPAMGPTFGPFIGGYLGEGAGWRWVMGMMAILAGLSWLMTVTLVPETYAPFLLQKRCQKLGNETGKVFKSELDGENHHSSPEEIIKTLMIRPLVLLFVEPIVFLLALYTAVVYGILYMLFGAYPVVFQLERGWSAGAGGLSFIGIAVGMFIALPVIVAINHVYTKHTPRSENGPQPPEDRLIGGIIGGIAVPIGMFWFAWTTYESIHWICPVTAGIPYGLGMTLIFHSVFSYLIDAYGRYSASALASNSVLRSMFGAAFPLFTRQMYDNLGTQWASSIPGFLAVLCVPVPILLKKFGHVIRQKSKYSTQDK